MLARSERLLGKAYLEDSVDNGDGLRSPEKRGTNKPLLVTVALGFGGGVVASLLVAYANHFGWAVAGAIVAAAILCLRIQRKVQRQIDPGDRELLQKLVEV